jgi:heme/copper-type cytochrome/quinol oxidase subunit 2
MIKTEVENVATTAEASPASEEAAAHNSQDAARAELLDAITKMTESATGAYLLFFGFLAYSILTIVASTDTKVIEDDSTVMPLINLAVPFRLFLTVAPMLAVGLFAYFAFYHYRAIELLQEFTITTVHWIQTACTHG